MEENVKRNKTIHHIYTYNNKKIIFKQQQTEQRTIDHTKSYRML